MSYVPPANRNNQHIRRYRATLYPLPKSDKVGNLTYWTQQANTVLQETTYRYDTGMRVAAVTSRYGGEWVHGMITRRYEGMGAPLYEIQDDNGKRHVIAENGVKFVLSIVLATQHTQAQQLAA